MKRFLFRLGRELEGLVRDVRWLALDRDKHSRDIDNLRNSHDSLVRDRNELEKRVRELEGRAK